MLSKVFDIAESNSYDNMTDDLFDRIRQNPEVLTKLSSRKRYRVYHTNMDHYQPDREVLVRLLSPVELGVDFETKQVSQPRVPITKCIVHFHGGGFVAMDSASHQNYTRQWANKLQVPVFSFDYRLAPANPYPDQINDCY